MQNDPAVVQARIDKLLARIATMESENRELRGTITHMEDRMKDKEKKLQEGLVWLAEVTMAREQLATEVERLRAEKIALDAHMDELRAILLKDNDAQTVLDALRHMTRTGKK